MQCTTAAWTIMGTSLMAARLLQTLEYRDEEFFLEDETKDGVRGKKEEDERAALMNFVPTEMAFLRPEVSQKDLVSCFLVLVFDSCSGF